MKQEIIAKLSRIFNFNQFHPDLTSTELIRKISSGLEETLSVNKFWPARLTMRLQTCLQ